MKPQNSFPQGLVCVSSSVRRVGGVEKGLRMQRKVAGTPDSELLGFHTGVSGQQGSPLAALT